MKPEIRELVKKLETKYHLARALGQKDRAINLWKLKIKLETYFLRKN